MSEHIDTSTERFIPGRFPYPPESCPGRIYHQDGGVGCSLCGTLLSLAVMQTVCASIVEGRPHIIPCTAVRTVLLSRLQKLLQRGEDAEVSGAGASTGYPFVSPKFLEAMNDIGRYGFEKYGEADVLTRTANGDFSRIGRTRPGEIYSHSAQHFADYLRGIPHDHFGTRRHQLAAVACNALLEFLLADLGNE